MFTLHSITPIKALAFLNNNTFEKNVAVSSFKYSQSSLDLVIATCLDDITSKNHYTWRSVNEMIDYIYESFSTKED